MFSNLSQEIGNRPDDIKQFNPRGPMHLQPFVDSTEDKKLEELKSKLQAG